jgi:transcriptional regulator GlxA family with amidase domain
MVRRGKVITAAGVSAGIDMALALAAEIEGPEFAKTLQLIMECTTRSHPSTRDRRRRPDRSSWGPPSPRWRA